MDQAAVHVCDLAYEHWLRSCFGGSLISGTIQSAGR